MPAVRVTRSMSFRTGIVFGGLMLLAAAFRLPQLQLRPMHSDEAINADRLGVLLERDEYKYSATDYHGPTLIYLTWPMARVQGIRRYVDLNETTLRLIPSLAGILLVGLHIFLVRYTGLIAASMAAMLTAISPAMVYYSRYYIHEMLLVLFTFGTLLAAFHYWEEKRASWAALCGICVGLMFATKETAIIPAVCMSAAAIAVSRLKSKRNDEISPNRRTLLAHMGISLTAAAATTAVLISSFFTNPRGIVDFVFAFRGYFLRGSGLGTPHVHSWRYYLRLMDYYRADGGPLFTEALITILAIVGLVAVFRQRRDHDQFRFWLFLAVYGTTMVAVYSLLPYKVPWNFIGPMHGIILLSGIGVAAMGNSIRNRSVRSFVAGLLLAGLAQLGWQAWRSSFPLNSDPRNPWVYAHTSKDVFTIIEKVELLAKEYPGGRSQLPIAVVSRENLWPLPWYLRRFPRAQWWNGISDTASAAPIYLITPDMEPALTRRLYDVPPPGQRDLYQNLFVEPLELRPGVELRGFASMSVWEGL